LPFLLPLLVALLQLEVSLDEIDELPHQLMDLRPVLQRAGTRVVKRIKGLDKLAKKDKRSSAVCYEQPAVDLIEVTCGIRPDTGQLNLRVSFQERNVYGKMFVS
jgi:hypothetical protein